MARISITVYTTTHGRVEVEQSFAEIVGESSVAAAVDRAGKAIVDAHADATTANPPGDRTHVLAKRYRKKPVVIEAMHFADESHSGRIAAWCGGSNEHSPREVQITTLEGTMTASIGDYVIRGVQGEFYPCKPDIFEATYEAASA